MDLFQGLVRGGLGGLLGGAAAHVLVTLLNRAGGELWLKGPYGPPFSNIALYMGVLLGTTGLALSLRLKPALVGFFGPLLGIALPMFVLTRAAPALPWAYAVGALYIASTWGSILALGALLSPERLSGALAAAAGSLAGYLFLAAMLWAVPSYKQVVWAPGALIPSPVALLDGLLTSAGLGAGVALASRRKS